jgi:hypothetical protein
MKVAVNRPGRFSRSKQSRSNVLPKYADSRRFIARRSAEQRRSLASEIFLTSLHTAFFKKPLVTSDETFLSVYPEPQITPRVGVEVHVLTPYHGSVIKSPG